MAKSKTDLNLTNRLRQLVATLAYDGIPPKMIMREIKKDSVEGIIYTKEISI
jgi:hypothetical protein